MTQAHAPEVITVAADADGVACDGGNSALGHPKVWYSFEEGNSVTCSYCGRLFQKSA